MANKKHSDTKQFFLGTAITIAVWALGIYISGYFPWFLAPVKVSDGCALLSKLFPFLLVIYSAVTALISKRKTKRKLFFGAYLFLLIPSVSFVITKICDLIVTNPLADFLTVPIIALAFMSIPAHSAFDGFFKAVYGNTLPYGFTCVHLIFIILMTVVAVLPPIIYRLVKSK